MSEKSEKYIKNNSQIFLNSSAQDNSSSDSLRLNKLSENNLDKNYSSNSRVIFIDEGRNLFK